MKQSLKQRVYKVLNERIKLGLTTEEELLRMGRPKSGQCQVFSSLIHNVTQIEPTIQHETVVRYIRLYKADLKKKRIEVRPDQGFGKTIIVPE